MTGKTLGIDTSLLIWLAIILLVTFVLSRTTFGRRVYAVGNSERVAHLAGVNVKLVTVSLYALSGLFAALAGIALTGFGGSATLGMGDPYLFSVDRRGCHRRHLHPRRTRQLPGDAGRGDRAHRAGQGAARPEHA